jgi:methionyl-tRNA synthetase
MMHMDDFAKVDLRVGYVREAAGVEGADKLVRLSVDLGPLGVKTVFAGLRKTYAPEQLVGRKVVVLANLAPRQMKFGLSEAMVLAADDGANARVLFADGDVSPGSRIK